MRQLDSKHICNPACTGGFVLLVGYALRAPPRTMTARRPEPGAHELITWLRCCCQILVPSEAPSCPWQALSLLDGWRF